MNNNERQLMPPAHAHSNSGLRVFIVFVQDAKGDLLDVEHYCNACASQLGINADYRWPNYSYGDCDVHCIHCHILLNSGVTLRERMYA